MNRRASVLFVGVLLLSVVLGFLLSRLYLTATRPTAVPERPTRTAARFAARGEPATRWPLASRGAPVQLRGISVQGRAMSLSRLRGRVVVVNLWASWCGPCREEAPVLARLWQKTASRGVSFVGVDIRDSRGAAVAFAHAHGIGYPSLRDDGGRAVRALRPYVPANAVPVTLVLDRSGRVAARVVGVVRETNLRKVLGAVLAEPAPAP